MKICAIICEFNPLHNGHVYLINKAKELSGCDAILCLMSGSFTQRGDICILDRCNRARHATLCGADAVLELPVIFSVAPAEIFASGAIKILSSIPAVDCLAFGCECGTVKDYSDTADLLLNESELFKNSLKRSLDEGDSYIKSYRNALIECGGNAELLDSPNAILGVEYTKAIKKSGSTIKILPVKRVGADFSDNELKSNYSSASAIRNNPLSPLIKDNVPPCVLADINDFSVEKRLFEQILRYELINSTPEDMRRIYGCSEGLENAILSRALLSYDKLIAKCTSKRYSTTRVKRILVANLLKLYQDECENYLTSPLYLRPLTVKKDISGEILAELASSRFPLILKQRDINKLSKDTALKCLMLDERAKFIWNYVFGKTETPFDYMQII